MMVGDYLNRTQQDYKDAESEDSPVGDPSAPTTSGEGQCVSCGNFTIIDSSSQQCPVCSENRPLEGGYIEDEYQDDQVDEYQDDQVDEYQDEQVDEYQDEQVVEPVVGMKFDGNKPDWALLPLNATEEVVKVLTYGAIKYAPDNWKELPNAGNRYFAAAMRHLVEHRRGEKLDHESGLPHLAHAVCSLMFLLEK